MLFSSNKINEIFRHLVWPPKALSLASLHCSSHNLVTLKLTSLKRGSRWLTFWRRTVVTITFWNVCFTLHQSSSGISRNFGPLPIWERVWMSLLQQTRRTSRWPKTWSLRWYRNVLNLVFWFRDLYSHRVADRFYCNALVCKKNLDGDTELG